MGCLKLTLNLGMLGSTHAGRGGGAIQCASMEGCDCLEQNVLEIDSREKELAVGDCWDILEGRLFGLEWREYVACAQHKLHAQVKGPFVLNLASCTLGQRGTYLDLNVGNILFHV